MAQGGGLIKFRNATFRVLAMMSAIAKGESEKNGSLLELRS